MTIAYPDDAAIARIAAGLLARSLPKQEWTHAAHFAATLHLLRHQSDFDGPRDLPAIIRAYNVAIGGQNTDTAGYHATITLASLRAAQSGLAMHHGLSLHSILDRLLAGPQGRSDWLMAYWSRDRLFSTDARRAWLAPDLAPLVF